MKNFYKLTDVFELEEPQRDYRTRPSQTTYHPNIKSEYVEDCLQEELVKQIKALTVQYNKKQQVGYDRYEKKIPKCNRCNLTGHIEKFCRKNDTNTEPYYNIKQKLKKLKTFYKFNSTLQCRIWL